MSGLIVLTFIPAVAAIMFLLRARTEMRMRIAAERRVAALERAARNDDVAAGSGSATDFGGPGQSTAAAGSRNQDSAAPAVDRRRRLLGVVAHELRSPISAILGYQELLAEGIFGKLDDRAHEAALRIRHASRQLLNLIDGMYELAHEGDRYELEIDDVELTELLRAAVHGAEAEGAGRGVTLESNVPDGLPTIATDAERLRRTVDLIIAAGIKASPGSTIALNASIDHDALRVAIDGSGLDPATDTPDPDAPESFRSGAALRIAMAGVSARALGGSITLDGAGESVRLTFALPLQPHG